MRELMDAGGGVLIAIVVLSVGAWFLLFGQWLRLRRCARRCAHWERRTLAPGDAPAVARAEPEPADIVARLLREGFSGSDPRRFFSVDLFEQALDSERAMLVRHLSVAGALATLAPLLGLLGTILGMMETFRVLAFQGSREVGAFAAGISRALITTEAGLVTALPILVLYGWLSGRAGRCVASARLCTRRLAGMLLAGRG